MTRKSLKLLAAFCVAALPAAGISQQSVTLDELMVENTSDLSEFRWTHRPVIVFADSVNDPLFAQQMDLLADRATELLERDVVILTDTNPDELGPLREKLRPRGFMMVLIGKDGGVKLRKPFPYNVRELTRNIDKMPIRQREIRDRRGDGS
ncbi:MAG: DUF4174 domain-containing protein [Pseudomonadota bacterium]